MVPSVVTATAALDNHGNIAVTKDNLKAIVKLQALYRGHRARKNTLIMMKSKRVSDGLFLSI
jgi:IQ calmodulin-binding motif.